MSDHKVHSEIDISAGVAFGSDGMISMRSYFSTHYLFGACHFATQCHGIESQHVGKSSFNLAHRSFVTSTVIMSVAFLEASINEFFIDAGTYAPWLQSLSAADHSDLAARWTAGLQKASVFGRVSIKGNWVEGKFDVAFEQITKAKLSPTGAIEDVKALITLRNAFMHYKPEWVCSAMGPHEMETLLSSRFPPNKLMTGSGNAYYPDHCLGYGCAKWAVESSLAFSDDYWQQIGLVPNYQSLRTSLNLSLPTP